MTTRVLCCSLLVLLVVSSSLLSAQWVPLGPPGPVSTFASSGAALYVGSLTGGGVFVSTNGGATWKSAHAGLPSLAITALAATPSKVYAAVSGEGIWSSTNAGATWTLASNGLISNSVNTIAAVGGDLFAGPSTFGAFRSTDGGDMWLPSGKGFATGMAIAFLGVGSRVFGASASAGVYISTDGGNNWTQSNNGLTSTAITSMAALGTTVFAATSNKGVFASTDNGAYWSHVGTGLPGSLVVSLAGVTPVSGTPCLLAAIGNGTLGITKNNGISWDTVDPGLTSRSLGALHTVGADVYAATGDGVLVSSDGGYHWRSVNAGLMTAQVSGIVPLPGAVMIGTKNGGVWASTDGGITWTAKNDGLGSVTVTGLTHGNAMTFAGTAAGVFALADGGAQWIPRNTGNADGVNTVKFLNGVLYTGPGARGIYSSTNNGVNWRFGGGSIWDLSGTIVQSFGPGGPVVMAGTSGKGVLESGDGGLGWAQLNAGLTNLDVLGFVERNGDVIAATGGGPFIAPAGAEHWTRADSGFEGNSCTALALFQDKLIAGSGKGGVFVSVDHGVSWWKANTGLSVPGVTSIEIDSPYVYCGTDGGGVYRRSLVEFLASLGVDDDQQVPDHFVLGQNYPNPFNPRSVIPYEIGASANGRVMVRISVYDVLGREIAVLVNEPKSPGRYTVDFSGAAFASGLYFCRMDAGGDGAMFRDVKKMMLLR